MSPILLPLVACARLPCTQGLFRHAARSVPCHGPYCHLLTCTMCKTALYSRAFSLAVFRHTWYYILPVCFPHCVFPAVCLQSCHVQDCLVLKGFLYHVHIMSKTALCSRAFHPVACTVLSDVSCPVVNVSPILLPLDHLYNVQDCLVLKAFSHRLISGTAVYESWTFVSVDHLYHEVTDRV